MRTRMRTFTAGFVVALMALPLVLAGSGGAQAAPTHSPHGLTVPATVTASNWSVMPDAVTTGTSATYAAHVSCVTSVFCMKVGPPSPPHLEAGPLSPRSGTARPGRRS